MIPKPFASTLETASRREMQLIESHWLANRDDLRSFNADLGQRIDAATATITAELAASVQHRQSALDAGFDALRAEITAPETLWQLTKEVTPIVLMFLPFPLALMAVLASIMGVPS